MRSKIKVVLGVLLIPISNLVWILDQIGRAQTVRDIPWLSWIVSPYFSPIAFAAAVALLGWAYYDIRISKEPAGFALNIERRSRLATKTAAFVVSAVVIFVVLPLIYRYGRTSRATVSLSAERIAADNLNPLTKPEPRPDVAVPSAPLKLPRPVPKRKTSVSGTPQLQINSAPNGIAIGGGTVTNPTVYNFAPPSRRIRPEYRTSVINTLKKSPTKAILKYTLGDESYRLVVDIYNVLKESGWECTNPIPVVLDKPGTGIQVRFHVDQDLHYSDGQMVDFPADSPAGYFIKALVDAGLNRGITVKPDVSQEKSSIEILVEPSPD